MKLMKFRVWDGKKFLSGIDLDNICLSLDGEVLVLEANELCLAGDEYKVQQFTGLKDKKGVEIYEGDILFWSSEQMMKNNTPMLYKNNYKATPVFWGGCEIIGNIFENPTLVK